MSSLLYLHLRELTIERVMAIIVARADGDVEGDLGNIKLVVFANLFECI